MKEKLPPNLDPNFTDIHPSALYSHYIPMISQNNSKNHILQDAVRYKYV